MTRNEMVVKYRVMLVSNEVVDWEKVNKMIIKKWGLSGLKYIKKKAWENKP